ncbi:MAG TPA: hypothetical protein DC047_16575 [Blastocatellia bacterium]|nr:hypothetical protein [Blastocatellia bacterium]
MNETNENACVIVDELEKFEGLLCEFNLTQVDLNQIEAFQQAQQIVENHSNDFPDTRGFDVAHHTAYLGAAIVGVRGRRSKRLR